jgi:hypothetical protein
MLRCVRCQEPLVMSGGQIIGQQPVSPVCSECLNLLATIMEQFMRRETFLVQGLNETKWIDAWYFCDACRGGPPQESAGFCPGCGKEKLQDTPAEKE